MDGRSAAIWLAAAVTAGCGSTKVGTVPVARAALTAPDLENVDAPALPWRPLIYPGEYAVYDLKLRGVIIGEIEVAAGQPGIIDGAAAHYVKVRGTTAGVAGLVSAAEIEVVAEITADPYRRRVATARWKTEFRGKERTGTPRRSYPPGRHNWITALVALRGWRPAPGQAATLALGSGSDELVLMADPTRLEGPFRRPARRLAGVGRSGGKSVPVEIWISDDRDRVPLLIRIETRWGEITLELVGYQSGDDGGGAARSAGRG